MRSPYGKFRELLLLVVGGVALQVALANNTKDVEEAVVGDAFRATWSPLCRLFFARC